MNCNESIQSCGGCGSNGASYGSGSGYGSGFGSAYGSYGRRQVVSSGRPIIIRPESSQYHVPAEPIYINARFASNSQPVCLNPRICVNSRAGAVEVNPVVVKVIKEIQRPCYVPAPAPSCGCGGESYSSGCGCESLSSGCGC